MRLVLAGVAGVGKTTVARLLSRMLGLPYRPVEAPECWLISDPAERQLCFTCSFLRQLGGYGVFDNSLLSVYAYSEAMLRRNPHRIGLYGAALSALELALPNGHTVVLAAKPETLAERIHYRLAREKHRRGNGTETDIKLHLEAQEHLLRIAESNNIPVIWTDDRTSEQVAKEIMKAVKAAEVAADAGR